MQLPAIGVEGSEDFDVEVCRCLRSLAHVQICRCFCLLVKILFLCGVCESLVCHGRSSSVKRVVVCPKPTHKEVLVCTRKHADRKASRCKSGCAACSSNHKSLHSNVV